MYSSLFNTVFVHIPKTGGQSVESLFVERHGLTWKTRAPLLLREKAPGERGPTRLAHLFAREYVDFGYLSEDAFGRAFKFAIVRNPYDRLVSEYRYRKERQATDFGSFVQSLPTMKDRHLAPQTSFVQDSAGRTIVDEVLRFEALQSEFDKVAIRIFGEPVDLPRINSAQASRPAEAADPELRRLIYRHYERDFDTFAYASK